MKNKALKQRYHILCKYMIIFLLKEACNLQERGLKALSASDLIQQCCIDGPI